MKTAIITGASSGIGKSASQQLLEQGWKVYGLSRGKPSINNDSFVWIKCDLADPNSITEATQSIPETIIDFFLSNAGVAFEEPASAATPDIV